MLNYGQAGYVVALLTLFKDVPGRFKVFFYQLVPSGEMEGKQIFKSAVNLHKNSTCHSKT